MIRKVELLAIGFNFFGTKGWGLESLVVRQCIKIVKQADALAFLIYNYNCL